MLLAIIDFAELHPSGLNANMPGALSKFSHNIRGRTWSQKWPETPQSQQRFVAKISNFNDLSLIYSCMLPFRIAVVVFHSMIWSVMNGRLHHRLDFESNDNKSQWINNLILSFLDRPSPICVKCNCQLHSGEPELSWSGHTKSNTCHLGRLCTQKEGGYYAAWLSRRDGWTARHDLGLFFSEEELSVYIESTCNMCQWLNLRLLWAKVAFTFRICLHYGLLSSGSKTAQ